MTSGALSPNTNASHGVYDTAGYDNAHSAQPLLMPVKVRNAIRACWDAAGHALDVAGRAGYADGSDLLGELGRGELSVTDFEERVDRTVEDDE